MVEITLVIVTLLTDHLLHQMQPHHLHQLLKLQQHQLLELQQHQLLEQMLHLHQQLKPLQLLQLHQL